MYNFKDQLKKNATKYDYPDDYDAENGTYRNKCLNCKHEFIGNKHRKICNVCKED